VSTTIAHVLAVVAVSDFDVSHEWYARFFGSPATNVPMPGNLAEWRVTDTGWLQVFHDPERAGTSMVNFAVDDLDQHYVDLHARSVDTDDFITVNKGVRLGSLKDPDNNTITLIGSFREDY
jgi:glyoxylase I family protein